MFLIDCTWVGFLLPCKDPPPFLPLSPSNGVIFHVKNHNDLVSYFLDVILPKEEINYQLRMDIIEIRKTLVLAKASV